MAITPVRWVLAISGGRWTSFWGKLCKKIKEMLQCCLRCLRSVDVTRRGLWGWIGWGEGGAGRGQVRHWLPEVEPVNWCKRCLHQPAPETEVLIVELVLTPRQPSLWLAPFCEVIVSDIANARRGNRLVQQPPPHPLSQSLWCVCVSILFCPKVSF